MAPTVVKDSGPADALLRAAGELDRRGQPFALVGGLGVSIRGEVRFTRDVDLAIAVSGDAETEALVLSLGTSGYTVVAVVEQEATKRLATVRLKSPSTIVVDLIAASSGIEAEVVARAEAVSLDPLDRGATIRVARAEELLALKVLSMTPARPQDWIDARSLRREPEPRPPRGARSASPDHRTGLSPHPGSGDEARSSPGSALGRVLIPRLAARPARPVRRAGHPTPPTAFF